MTTIASLATRTKPETRKERNARSVEGTGAVLVSAARARARGARRDSRRAHDRGVRVLAPRRAPLRARRFRPRDLRARAHGPLRHARRRRGASLELVVALRCLSRFDAGPRG